MSSLSSLSRTLGANLAAYSAVADADAEEREFKWAEAKRRRVVALIQSLGPLDRVADIGCRGGREAAFYKQECAIGAMHGFEIAEEPLVLAERRGIVPHRWISGEQPCPVPDGFFDLVMALDVIEHLFDTDVFLQEVSRILSPVGHALIATPNLGWWWSRLRLLRGAPPSGIGATSPTMALDAAVDTKHLRINVLSEWVHLFQSHGFVCRSINGYNFPRLLKSPFNLIDDLMVNFASLAHSSIFLLQKAARSAHRLGVSSPSLALSAL